MDQPESSLPTESPETAPSIRPDQLAAALRAMRFALGCIVLGFSYLGVRAALSIPSFRQVFADMLGGKELPALTRLVLNSSSLFLLLSIAVPVAALWAMVSRGLVRPFYVLGVLALVTLIQLIVLYNALSAPFVMIVSAMSGNP